MPIGDDDYIMNEYRKLMASHLALLKRQNALLKTQLEIVDEVAKDTPRYHKIIKILQQAQIEQTFSVNVN